MAAGGAFGGGRGLQPTPPEKGVFPLDHLEECKPAMKAYMECLKANKYESEKCRKFSKDYLECRMERNLMVKQDLTELGFFKEGGSTGQNKVEGLEAPSLKQSSQQDGQGSVSISGTLKHSQQEDTESVHDASTLKQSSQHDGRAGFISGLPKRAAAKSS
ncbi:unnamed protein product [Sphagnum troendelagicum]|uniref:CHCH domain-containing protein n=1 Tax=Sphagnum troendelagicum TaxID=128251 RepID=A0ABP0TMQ7_9BRYO